MPKLHLSKIILAVFLLLAVYLFKFTGLSELLTLDNLKSQQVFLQSLMSQRPVLMVLLFVGLYIGCTAISLPVATLLTLTGGMLFGSLFGTILAVFSASVGAVLAFLSGRYLFRTAVETRFQSTIEKLNKGLNENPFWFVLSSRLIPLFPFFVFNLAFGLTSVPMTLFFIGSLVGMIPILFIYANAGSKLAQINDVADILTGDVLFSLSLLAGFVIVSLFFRLRKKKA